jgi:hypothetical protein
VGDRATRRPNAAPLFLSRNSFCSLSRISLTFLWSISVLSGANILLFFVGVALLLQGISAQNLTHTYTIPTTPGDYTLVDLNTLFSNNVATASVGDPATASGTPTAGVATLLLSGCNINSLSLFGTPSQTGSATKYFRFTMTATPMVVYAHFGLHYRHISYRCCMGKCHCYLHYGRSCRTWKRPQIRYFPRRCYSCRSSRCCPSCHSHLCSYFCPYRCSTCRSSCCPSCRSHCRAQGCADCCSRGYPQCRA